MPKDGFKKYNTNSLRLIIGGCAQTCDHDVAANEKQSTNAKQTIAPEVGVFFESVDIILAIEEYSAVQFLDKFIFTIFHANHDSMQTIGNSLIAIPNYFASFVQEFISGDIKQICIVVFCSVRTTDFRHYVPYLVYDKAVGHLSHEDCECRHSYADRDGEYGSNSYPYFVPIRGISELIINNYSFDTM